MLKNQITPPNEISAQVALPQRAYKDFALTLAQLDALPWQTTLSVTAYGLTITVRTNDPAVLTQVQDHLPCGWEPAAGPLNGSGTERLYSLWVAQPSPRQGAHPYHLLYFGKKLLRHREDLEIVLKQLETHSQLYVGEHATERVFVHAGVVGYRGQAIVIPARSFSGKSSLVTALLKAGATYYSDEYALLDHQGRVWPYPIDISLRARDGQPARKCPPEAFGAMAGTEPLPVGLIVASKYESGATWRPQTLSPGRALLALLDNTVCARSNPGLAIPILRRVAGQAPALTGKRGEAEVMVPALLALLDSRR